MKKFLGRVLLTTILSVSGCSTLNQQLDPEVYYKRDIGISVNGVEYAGTISVPKADSYDLVLKPKGDVDLLLIRTCHAEYSCEKSGCEKKGGGLFSKKEVRFVYTPVPGLEDIRVCPLRIDAYESKKGRHSWAFIDFEHPDYKVEATLKCNGYTSFLNGVGVCQGKKGTIQRIEFKEPIRFAPPKPSTCGVPYKMGNGYEFPVVVGECLYHFDTQSGKLGRLTVVGYDGVLIREDQ